MTQHKIDRNPTEPMDTCEDDPDQQGSPDDEEDKELIIDLVENMETMNEESEINRIKNKVISELIKEEMGVWTCKACEYKHKLPNRVHYHIENSHFNGPPCPCEFCDTACKNQNALKQHVNRHYKDKYKKRREDGKKLFTSQTHN